MIRPEARAWVARHAELGFSAVVALAGVWLMWLGGYLLLPLGAVVVLVALTLAVFALRRLRFAQSADGPGMVEIREAQIGFLGPDGGGFVSQRELSELRLLTRTGHRYWRLKQEDGQALLIPVDAHGAERLFDAFAALPGMDSRALVEALEVQAPGGDAALGLVIWRRQQALATHAGA